MAKFSVRVEEKSTLVLDIEAQSATEAYDIVDHMVAEGELLFDEGRVDYDIDVQPASDK